MRRTPFLAVSFAIVSCSAAILVLSRSAHSQTAFKRDRAIHMLEIIRDEVKKHYYDPKFHGVDIEAKFAEAKEKIRGVDSLNRAFSIIADALDSLQDSHTYFVPPPRPYTHEYGFRSVIIGENCYITAVRPETDAAAKGVKPGDLLRAINTHPAVRAIFPKLEYVYYELNPQPQLRLELQSPDGISRQVDIEAKINESKRVLDFNDIFNRVNQMEDPSREFKPRYAEYGDDLFIVKLNSFLVETSVMDSVASKASKHKAVVFDLRGNPGGSVDALQQLVRHLFDHDVLIATRVTRGGPKPQTAKGTGDHAYSGTVIVLVDSRSASAAEIFARVIQLEKRGTVLGDRTSGSVMEARFYDEQEGLDTFTIFGISITEADVLTSDGKTLEHVGVTPDEIALPTAADLAAGRDPVLSRAAELAGVKLSPADAGKLFPITWPKL